MIVDFHTHIFPDKIKKDRENFFDNEPAFKMLYSSPNARISGVDELISTMDENEVAFSMVFGFPWKNGETAKRNNDYIMASVAKFPGRLKGFACFDMEWSGAPYEVERCIAGGLCGVGELAFYLSGIDDEALLKLAPVMEVCFGAGNLPVMIHTNEPVGHIYPGKTPNTLEQIYKLAATFPDNRIVLAHWGGGILFYNLLKKEAGDVLKNVWYDTAASPFLYRSSIYRVAYEAGVIDKVLFGSDYPLLKPSRYYKDLNESNVSKENKRKILGENACLLMDL
ncbi:amidohydrolase family protein [Desulfamplus magnetovallimortis]|nr:amidohydrolase family protein [Desulfamplus magnetovallimortis]